MPKISLKSSKDEMIHEKHTKQSFHLQDRSTGIDLSAEDYETAKRNKFTTLNIISSFIIYFLKKCWLSFSAAVFVVFVIYWCYGGIFAFILFLFALSGFIFQLGDFFLYHPDQPPQSRLYVPSPSLVGLPSESIFLKTADGVTIHSFFIKQEPSIIGHVPTVLYFHGNAGNIGHRLPNVQGLYRYCGCNIMLIEYRGYGHSDGSPSEEGFYLDAQAGLNYLLQLSYINKEKIIVFGRSLGGAVAIDLASQSEFSKHILALIAENTFTSIPEIAKEMFNLRIIRKLPTWAFKNQYSSSKKIKYVKTPSLFISGLADAIIPSHMMKSLWQANSSPLKRLQTFEHGTHNETWQCRNYYTVINLFIDDVLLSQKEVQQWPSIFESGGEVY